MLRKYWKLFSLIVSFSFLGFFRACYAQMNPVLVCVRVLASELA